jgi:glycogen debranching enzyme
MISAYNGGTGGVLSTFDSDRKRAMNELNSLNPTQVYDALSTQNPKGKRDAISRKCCISKKTSVKRIQYKNNNITIAKNYRDVVYKATE